MTSDADRDHQVAARPAVRAGAALTAHAERLPVVDTGRNTHLCLEAAAHLALALAALTGRTDDLARTPTFGTDAVGLHDHAHEILLGAHRAASVAARADLGFRPRCSARAVTAVTILDA